MSASLETVNEIGFSNPAAEYPEPTEPSYPAAVGMAGAPFADPNLKLVVLSSLLDAKQIDLGTPAQPRATSWDAPSISRMKARKSFPRHRTIWSDIR